MHPFLAGCTDCMETMHGFRPGEADEDLGWYDTGLEVIINSMYFDFLVFHSKYREKPAGWHHRRPAHDGAIRDEESL